MGDTYGFCKVRKDKFMSGKSRFIMDSDNCCIEDDNPDYIDEHRQVGVFRMQQPAKPAFRS